MHGVSGAKEDGLLKAHLAAWNLLMPAVAEVVQIRKPDSRSGNSTAFG